MNHAVRSWRFSGQFFENTVELGERLESSRKGDLAGAQIDFFQELARFLESGSGNVIDKLYAGHLFELLAQMIPADVDRLCHLGQRKLFIRMLVDKIPRFPDFDRLRSIPLSRTNII